MGAEYAGEGRWYWKDKVMAGEHSGQGGLRNDETNSHESGCCYAGIEGGHLWSWVINR